VPIIFVFLSLVECLRIPERAVTTTTTTCANLPYNQCGGVGYTGPTCCPYGYSCQSINGVPICRPLCPTPVPCAPQYGQCGGIGFAGTTCCLPGFTCMVDNAFFSTCQNTTNAGITTPTTRPTLTTGPTVSCPLPTTPVPCAPQYGQCGGTGFTGPHCCLPGFTCVVNNAFFSTCQKK